MYSVHSELHRLQCTLHTTQPTLHCHSWNAQGYIDLALATQRHPEKIRIPEKSSDETFPSSDVSILRLFHLQTFPSADISIFRLFHLQTFPSSDFSIFRLFHLQTLPSSDFSIFRLFQLQTFPSVWLQIFNCGTRRKDGGTVTVTAQDEDAHCTGIQPSWHCTVHCTVQCSAVQFSAG